MTRTACTIKYDNTVNIPCTFHRSSVILVGVVAVLCRLSRALQNFLSRNYEVNTADVDVDVDVEDVLAQAMCLYASFSGK